MWPEPGIKVKVVFPGFSTSKALNDSEEGINARMK